LYVVVATLAASFSSSAPAAVAASLRLFILLLLLLLRLQDGKLVEAKVIWVGETEVKVVIQSNGMEAIIPQVSCA
jgi:uncharacterized membrane protein